MTHCSMDGKAIASFKLLSLQATTSSKVASVISTMLHGVMRPAAWTMSDTTGRLSRAHARSLATADSSDQSHCLTTVLWVRLLISSRNASSTCPDTDVKTSVTFRRASWAATTRPRPRVPPEMMIEFSNGRHAGNDDDEDVDRDDEDDEDDGFDRTVASAWPATRRSAAARSRHTSTANSVSMSRAEKKIPAGIASSRKRIVGMYRRLSCSSMLAMDTPS